MLLLAWMLFRVGTADAALGGDAASVLSDGAALQGAVNATGMLAYEVDEIIGTADLRVREFVGVDGTVFAVSWSGPVLPDLQRLLGNSFNAYAAAVAGMPHPGLRRSVHVSLPGLVVESGGHLRAYTGRAYLPARVPDGVRVSDIH